MRESAASKARRYLVEGRPQVQFRHSSASDVGVPR